MKIGNIARNTYDDMGYTTEAQYDKVYKEVVETMGYDYDQYTDWCVQNIELPEDFDNEY